MNACTRSCTHVNFPSHLRKEQARASRGVDDTKTTHARMVFRTLCGPSESECGCPCGKVKTGYACKPPPIWVFLTRVQLRYEKKKKKKKKKTNCSYHEFMAYCIQCRLFNICYSDRTESSCTKMITKEQRMETLIIIQTSQIYTFLITVPLHFFPQYKHKTSPSNERILR